jgi:signal transduction histidine kinase
MDGKLEFGSRTNRGLLILLGLLIFLVSQPVASSHAQVSQPVGPLELNLGQSVAPLDGPWKFHIGDSPLDPVSHEPVWARPDFDDSRWESLYLSPKGGKTSPYAGGAAWVPGWTANGYPDYWGYAWYRIKLQLTGLPRAGLAIAGPVQVDDAYQVFANGRTLGSFGNFRGRTPTTYYNQPAFFRLPEPEDHGGGGAANLPVLIAFRVWMDPASLSASDASGGIRSAPLLGDSGAVHAAFLIQRLELIRPYSSWAVEAILYALMTVVAFSLILFDRSDRVYLWIGGVLLCTAAYSALAALDVWTQGLSILADTVVTEVILGPLAYAGWLIVWWIWFGRRWPAWLPGTVAILTAAYMVSFAIGKGLFYPVVPHQVAVGFEIASLFVRFLFFALLMRIVVEGIVRQGLEGWLVLPAILLLGVGLFHNELTALHVHVAWLAFGIRFSIAQIANLLLAGVLALLLLRRLLASVRRQREISFTLKQAQLQSDFVAAVSHEFRSPLTTIRTITELLAHNRITDESRRQQSYVYLERETTRLHRLVEDLLDFGRMESGRKQYRVAAHDAFELVRGTVTEFAEQAAANGFLVKSEFPMGNGHSAARIHVDEEALRRAVRNLLDNAMKYSPECRTIWVNGSVEGNQVCISVRDQGMGIGVDEQQAIFQKFVRGDATKEAGIKGTGIGLAMVRQIVEAMHGEVRLKSEIGVGSTFTLVLPLAEN